MTKLSKERFKWKGHNKAYFYLKSRSISFLPSITRSNILNPDDKSFEKSLPSPPILINSNSHTHTTLHILQTVTSNPIAIKYTSPAHIYRTRHTSKSHHSPHFALGKHRYTYEYISTIHEALVSLQTVLTLAPRNSTGANSNPQSHLADKSIL